MCSIALNPYNTGLDIEAFSCRNDPQNVSWCMSQSRLKIYSGLC